MEKPKTDLKTSATCSSTVPVDRIDRMKTRFQAAATTSVDRLLADRVVGTPEIDMQEMFERIDHLSKSAEGIPAPSRAQSQKQAQMLSKCLNRLEEDLELFKMRLFDFLDIYVTPEERAEHDTKLAARSPLDEGSVDPWDLAAAEMDTMFRFLFEEFALRFKATIGLDPSDPLLSSIPQQSSTLAATGTSNAAAAPDHPSSTTTTDASSSTSSSAVGPNSGGQQLAMKQAMYNSELKHGIYVRDVEAVRRDMQVMLLKKQVVRRNHLLADARSKYFKELISLKQEVLKKDMYGDKYQSEFKQFVDWDNIDFGDEETEQKSEEMMKSKLFKVTMEKVEKLKQDHEMQMKNVQADVANLKKALEYKENDIDSLKRKLSLSDETWMAKIKSEYPDPEEHRQLKASLEAAQTDVSQKQAIIETLEFSVRELSALIDHTKDELNTAQEESRDLRSQLDATKQRAEDAETRSSNLEQKLNEEERELKESLEKVGQLEKEVSHVAAELQESEHSLQAAKSRAENAESKVSDLSVAVESSEREIELAKAAAARDASGRDDLFKMTQSLQSELSTLNSEKEQNAEQRARESEEALSKSEAENARLRAECDRLRNELMKALETRTASPTRTRSPLPPQPVEKPTSFSPPPGGRIIEDSPLTGFANPVVSLHEVEEIVNIFNELQTGIDELRAVPQRGQMHPSQPTIPHKSNPSTSYLRPFTSDESSEFLAGPFHSNATGGGGGGGGNAGDGRGSPINGFGSGDDVSLPDQEDRRNKFGKRKTAPVKKHTLRIHNVQSRSQIRAFVEGLEVFERLEQRAQSLYEKLHKKRQEVAMVRHSELERVLSANHHLASRSHSSNDDYASALPSRAATAMGDVDMIRSPMPLIRLQKPETGPPPIISGQPPPSVLKPITAISQYGASSIEIDPTTGGPRPATVAVDSPTSARNHMVVGGGRLQISSPTPSEHRLDRKWPSSFVSYKSRKSYEYQQISPVGLSHSRSQLRAALGSDEGGSDSDSSMEEHRHPRTTGMRSPSPSRGSHQSRSTTFAQTHHQPVPRVTTYHSYQQQERLKSVITAVKPKRQFPTAPGLSRLERVSAEDRYASPENEKALPQDQKPSGCSSPVLEPLPAEPEIQNETLQAKEEEVPSDFDYSATEPSDWEDSSSPLQFTSHDPPATTRSSVPAGPLSSAGTIGSEALSFGSPRLPPPPPSTSTDSAPPALAAAHSHVAQSFPPAAVHEPSSTALSRPTSRGRVTTNHKERPTVLLPALVLPPSKQQNERRNSICAFPDPPMASPPVLNSPSSTRTHVLPLPPTAQTKLH